MVRCTVFEAGKRAAPSRPFRTVAGVLMLVLMSGIPRVLLTIGIDALVLEGCQVDHEPAQSPASRHIEVPAVDAKSLVDVSMDVRVHRTSHDGVQYRGAPCRVLQYSRIQDALGRIVCHEHGPLVHQGVE